MENWFATWFNSHYYHILYKNRDNAEAEKFVNNIIDRLKIPRGSRILDLACGKGRHSLQFRKAGYDVIGVDLAEESILEAKKLEREGLEFFVHDMRELYWSDHFNLVVNLFTSFGYFHNHEDDLKTISAVADALTTHGLFILDFLNAVKVEENLIDYEEKVIDEVKFEITRSVENEIIVKRIHIIDGSDEFDFEEQVDALKLDNFKQYFDKAGLDLINTYGDYELNPFKEKTSDRLILLGKKRG